MDFDLLEVDFDLLVFSDLLSDLDLLVFSDLLVFVLLDLDDLELLLFLLLLRPRLRVLSGLSDGVTMYGFCLVLIITQIISQTVRGFFVGFTVGLCVEAVVGSVGGQGGEGEVLAGGCSVVVRAVVVGAGSEVVGGDSVVVATV